MPAHYQNEYFRNWRSTCDHPQRSHNQQRYIFIAAAMVHRSVWERQRLESLRVALSVCFRNIGGTSACDSVEPMSPNPSPDEFHDWTGRRQSCGDWTMILIHPKKRSRHETMTNIRKAVFYIFVNRKYRQLNSKERTPKVAAAGSFFSLDWRCRSGLCCG